MYLHSDTKLYHDILLWICRTDLRMSCTTTFFCGYVVRTSKCHAPRHSSVDMSYGPQNVMHHDILLWICRTDLRMSCTTFCGYVVRTSECHARHSVDMSYGPQNVMHDFLWISHTGDISIVCHICILTRHSTTNFFCGNIVRTSGVLQIRRTDLRMLCTTTFCGYVVRTTYPSCDKFSFFWHNIPPRHSSVDMSYGPQDSCRYVVRTSECHTRHSVGMSYGWHIHRVTNFHSDTTFFCGYVVRTSVMTSSVILLCTLRSHSVLWVRSSMTPSVILSCTHRSHSIMYSQKSFCFIQVWPTDSLKSFYE